MSEGRYTPREKRTDTVSVTVTPSDRSLIAAAAIRTGMTISSFVAYAAAQAAREQMAQAWPRAGSSLNRNRMGDRPPHDPRRGSATDVEKH